LQLEDQNNPAKNSSPAKQPTVFRLFQQPHLVSAQHQKTRQQLVNKTRLFFGRKSKPAEGGCLIWESDEQGESVWEQLPLWARKQIIVEKIRVFTLPGFQIARQATDRADLQLRM
jgi:hypothetical protein